MDHRIVLNGHEALAGESNRPADAASRRGCRHSRATRMCGGLYPSWVPETGFGLQFPLQIVVIPSVAEIGVFGTAEIGSPAREGESLATSGTAPSAKPCEDRNRGPPRTSATGRRSRSYDRSRHCRCGLSASSAASKARLTVFQSASTSTSSCNPSDRQPPCVVAAATLSCQGPFPSVRRILNDNV